MISYLPFPQKSIRSELAKLFPLVYLKKVISYAVHGLRNVTFFGRLLYLLSCIYHCSLPMLVHVSKFFRRNHFFFFSIYFFINCLGSSEQNTGVYYETHFYDHSTILIAPLLENVMPPGGGGWY